MKGVVAQLATLAHILELDTLDLDLLEPLPEDGMGAEVVAVGHGLPGLAVGLGLAGSFEGLADLIAGRDDPDAAREQGYRRAGLSTARDQVGVHAGVGKALGVG